MIRKATVHDIASIERIYDHIHTAEETNKAVIGWNRNIYPVKSTALMALDRDDLFVLADDTSGKIVGTAILNQIQVPEYYGAPWEYDAPDHAVMVMHTLVIDPEEKHKGYGREFARFYEEYAALHGCQYLRIDTNAKNLAARAFYKTLGYREIAIVPCVFNGLPDVELVLLEKKLS